MKRFAFILILSTVVAVMAGCESDQQGKDVSVDKAKGGKAATLDKPGAAVVKTREDLPPLVPETLGATATLPSEYPSNWVFVHDAAFAHMLEGRMIIIDPLAENITGQYRGMMNISFMGHFIQATTRPELYISERFYSRGVRGKRTDVITIYNTASLKPIDEIVLTEAINFRGMPERYAMALLDNERLLLTFNMTPATSVTVMDVVKREILSEVSIPGCSLMYPTGERGFTSLCSNGGLLSTQLDEKGQVLSQKRVGPFFNVDSSPIFERPAIINGVAYFPGFSSEIHPVDLTGPVAVPGEPWSLVSEQERKEAWRPGGVGLIDKDTAGNFYVLMHPNGHDGTQSEAGAEVWVVDPVTRQHRHRIKLKTRGLSIGVTKEENPLLIVTNTDMNVDVYRVNSGKYIRTISHFGQETPLMVYAVR
ncbi:MAG: amine dehydrogenase large subunit [Gammaproteobacteria bacterium]